MAKAKQSPPPADIPAHVETVDDTNKAVIDNTPPAPQPLDLRIAAMLGMGLDVVRERLEQLDEDGYAQVERFVEAKSHADLGALLAARS